MSDIAQAARALLERWHGPGLGRMVSATDPRANPVDGRITVTGGRNDAVVGPAVSRVHVIGDDGAATDPFAWEAATRMARWSPDGARLAFTSDRVQRGIHQLAFADSTDLGNPTDGPPLPGTIEQLAWSPDGRSVLALVAGYGAEHAGAMASGRVPVRPEDQRTGPAPIVRTFPGVAPEGEWRRLWVVTGGEARCVTPHGPNVWEAAWAGDGHVVAVVSDRPEEDAWYGARVSLLDVADGGERPLVSSARQLGVPAGSPDGTYAACIEAPCSDRTLVAGRLVLVDLARGRVDRRDLGLDATHLVWLDGRRLLVSGLVGMDTRIVELDAVDGTITERWRTSACVGPRQPEAWPTPGDGLVLAADSWDDPPYVAEITAAGDVVRRWSGAHPGTFAIRSELTDLQLRRWTAPDGWEIDGLLATPTGPGPHPLVLYPHGGPVAMWRARFAAGYAAVPLLLERGFAVLMPNPRGSCGYGWEFADAVHGDMGGLDTYDLLSGIDALVADGTVDPDRLAVMGGSYAGYMTCWLVTQTQRFKAACASAAVTNWIGEHYQSNIPQWGARFLPDADAFPGGGYVSRSPVFFADRVTTPTFLTCGAHDRCCPPTQSIEFHEALRQLGVPTELVIYPDDAHNVPTGDNLVDYLEREVDWIERWCR